MQPASFDHAAKVIERAHLELVVKKFNSLWTESRQSGNFT
jgi:hypothetical protein